MFEVTFENIFKTLNSDMICCLNSAALYFDILCELQKQKYIHK